MCCCAKYHHVWRCSTEEVGHCLNHRQFLVYTDCDQITLQTFRIDYRIIWSCFRVLFKFHWASKFVSILVSFPRLLQCLVVHLWSTICHEVSASYNLSNYESVLGEAFEKRALNLTLPNTWFSVFSWSKNDINKRLVNRPSLGFGTDRS